MKKYSKMLTLLLVTFCFFIQTAGCGLSAQNAAIISAREQSVNSIVEIKDEVVPLGTPAIATYVPLNQNVPFFSDADKARCDAFELYSPLDAFGRCGVAYANICKELQPTEERGEIGSITPSGWQTIKYNGVVDGNYLYNRCHLIGYQLSGENANPHNLITGTRYLNVSGMLPFENMVDEYVDRTNNHVLYRVTPDFHGNDLVASGVEIEAWSVEDEGKGICFNVYCYNIQPGIIIDYATGNSQLDPSYSGTNSQQEDILNNSTGASSPASGNVVSNNQVWISETGAKYHSKNNCGTMNPDKATTLTENEAISRGYEKCKKCW